MNSQYSVHCNVGNPYMLSLVKKLKEPKLSYVINGDYFIYDLGNGCYKNRVNEVLLCKVMDIDCDDTLCQKMGYNLILNNWENGMRRIVRRLQKWMQADFKTLLYVDEEQYAAIEQIFVEANVPGSVLVIGAETEVPNSAVICMQKLSMDGVDVDLEDRYHFVLGSPASGMEALFSEEDERVDQSYLIGAEHFKDVPDEVMWQICMKWYYMNGNESNYVTKRFTYKRFQLICEVLRAGVNPIFCLPLYYRSHELFGFFYNRVESYKLTGDY